MSAEKLVTSEQEILVQNGYAIGVEIGKGSFADVHLADYKDSKSGEYHLLACRIFDKEREGIPKDFLDNMLSKELDILTKIRNPHLIQVHSIIEIKQKIFIFMRFEERGNLLEYLKNNDALNEPCAKRWLRQMASGLHYLHGEEIAHRDLKCENILISKNGNVKIGDFGFATYCVDEEGRRVLNTTYCGSVSYAAPEVLSGTPHDPKPADVWSLGVILFIMLTAQMPFDDSESVSRIVQAQVTRSWSWRVHQDWDGRVSAAAATLLGQMLRVDTVHRLDVQEVLAHEWLVRNSKEGFSPPSVRRSIYTNTHRP